MALSGGEGKLGEADGGLTRFLDGMSCAVVLIDGERVLYANPAMAGLVGCSAERLASMGVAGLVEASDRPLVEQAVDARLGGAGDAPDHLELRLVGGGDPVFVRMALSRVELGGRGVVLCNCFDLTAYRMAEERSESRRQELEAIRAALPDLHFYLDDGGRILDFHAGRTGDLYTTPDRFLGRRMDEVLPGGVGKRLSGAVDEALVGGRIVVAEYTLPLPGGEKDFECRIVPMADRRHALAVVRDIGERRRHEAERERLLGELQVAVAEGRQALRAREEFLSIASHEFATPLTSLRLALEGIEASLGTVPDPADRMIVIARRQGDRLARLVSELTDVTRLEADRVRLDLADVDLAEVVRDVGSRFMDEIIQAGCGLELLASRPVLGRWDRSRLDQVVTNLLSNAIKYGAGKPIELEVSSEGAASNLRARLSCRDRGVGIHPEGVPRIFQPYQRAVSGDRYGGLGLGLYIVRRLVEMHGGTVEVDSAPGEGSTFTVWLPCGARSDEVTS